MKYYDNKPELILIHHSYNPEDNVTRDDFNAITRYYMREKGFVNNPYHYGIERINGVLTLKKGRDEDFRGAHEPDVNGKSIGICFIGNFDDHAPDEETLKLGALLIQDIYTRWGKLPIEPHNKYAHKSCPGDLFPMARLQELVDGEEHWGKLYRDRLIDRGINISDERYEDNMTRAEVFAMIEKTLEVYDGK